MATNGRPRVVAIVQARMGSTRLPGKVLADLGGEPVLARVVARARAIPSVDEVVVATTTAPADDPVVALAQRLGVAAFRGSEDDVLSRYVGAARAHHADVVVRLTADCPLLDPRLADEVITRLASTYHDATPIDLASNGLRLTYPRGLDVEAIRRDALERADTLVRAPREREHVTLFVCEHPELFRLASVEHQPDLSHHRWTVDTEADLALARAVYARLADAGPTFGWERVLEVLAREPALAQLNDHVRQKEP